MMVDNMKKIVVSRGKDQGENVRGIWGLFWFNPEEVAEIGKKHRY